MIRRLDVEYRQSARDDLTGIFGFIVENGASVEAALKFVLRIEDRCQKVGDAPRGGRPRDDLLAGLRTVPFERSAVIAYVIEQDMVWITNIFYGGRDFEALLRDGDASSDGD
jgi:toxin ParE1/3/4